MVGRAARFCSSRIIKPAPACRGNQYGEAIMAFKKSVRITDEAAAIMAPLGSPAEDGMNWSGSINAMAEQFGLIIGELTPDFTDDQWKAVYCCFNGYIPHPDIKTEASLLPWHISEGYQFDG